MSDFEDDDLDREEPPEEQDDPANEAPVVEGGRLAEVKAMIAQELLRGQLADEQADALLARTRELEQRMDAEEQELAARHFPDDFDAHLASKALYDKHIKMQRAIEFAALGVNLGYLASDYDRLLANLANPLWDGGRHSALWRSLDPETRDAFRQRVLAKGELTSEQLDRLIEENWE